MMLTFSRKSLLYKIYDIRCWTTPTNLCQYVRGIVWSALYTVVKFAAMSIAAACLGFWILVLLAAPWLSMFGIYYMPGTTELSCILYFLAGSIILTHLVYEEVQRRKRVHGPREPSVFGEYLKAKKSKVCPLITFK